MDQFNVTHRLELHYGSITTTNEDGKKNELNPFEAEFHLKLTATEIAN